MVTPTDQRDRRVNALEMRMTRHGSVRDAVILCERCWLEWKISRKPDDRAFLHKANHTVVQALRKNESDVRLIMLSIFISIEADRFDNANEMLDKAMGFRPFLRNNEPFFYAVLFFLYAYLEIKQKRARSAKKHMKALQDFIKQSDGAPAYTLMLGMLHLAFYEYDEARVCLTAAYDGGCRSVFLYQSLYHYYRTALRTSNSVEKNNSWHTLLPLLHWAAARKADIADIISVYQDELHTFIAADPSVAEYVYLVYQNSFILREICASRMLAGDYGPEAYEYYREAEQKQIYINGLYQFLIKAAYVNRAEHISHYAMKQFLRTADMDADMKVYIFHLLLTDPALADLVPERKNEILQLCTYCLENGLKGRIVNSLYYFFWMQCREMNIVNQNVDKAETLLFDDLTRFWVTAEPRSAVRYLYINEREKKGLDLYELDPETKIAVINAVDADFVYTCLNTGRKNIVDEPITVKRMVTRAEPALYRYFFRRGARDFYLLAHLANHWLARLAETDELEDPSVLTEEAIPVLEALLAHKETARPYGMRIRVALGGLCYRAGRFDLALEYYGGVDENELDKLAAEDKAEDERSASMEQILNVFLQTHEFARAAGLIMRKKKYISNKVLFNAIKKLSGPEYATHHANLADAAYGLLLDAWYDPDLLRIALAYYNGGQSEWQALSRSLAALNITAPGLDEIIIKNSIWMHQFDEDAQKAFVRLIGENGGPDYKHPLVGPFVEYGAYEMMLNGARPEYETLTLLEKIFLQDVNGGALLAWALCHVYLTYNITTFYSDQVTNAAITLQEKADILFPVFRENRDKRHKCPFVEKNQPFVYRSLPDKNVWLHYRIDDAPAFQAKPMRYLRFGLYLASLPLFFGEKLTYYFSEELPTGSITTREKTVTNDSAYLHDGEADPFFTINNAIIYEQMFKYENVERIITGLVRDVKQVRGGLM